MSESSLQGTTVLVTGATAGIGRACAEQFAAAGARLAICGRRASRLEALAKELSERHGADVHAFPLDVRGLAQVEKALASFPAGFRDIDILVNNAGLALGMEPVQEGRTDDWDEMIDTNVRGLLYVTRTVVGAMVKRGRGHVINIGSIAGHEVYPGGNVYCASKFAVTAINRGLAIDTLGTGVRVSSVDPGMVDTEFSLVRFHGDAEKAGSVYDGLQPLSGQDVADAVEYCASRPPHANVREMILMPTAQADAVHTHREPKS